MFLLYVYVKNNTISPPVNTHNVHTIIDTQHTNTTHTIIDTHTHPSNQHSTHSPLHIDICLNNVHDCIDFSASFIKNNDIIGCAFYELNEPTLVGLLTQQHTPLIVHEYHNQTPYTRKAHQPRGLMHHKFCISEHSVLVGSMNPTRTDATTNDNHMLVIYHQPLAYMFTQEWHRLNNNLSRQAFDTYISYEHINISAHICHYQCVQMIRKHIYEATQSIYFFIFTFTDMRVGVPLIEKHQQGVDVQGVVEKRSASHDMVATLRHHAIPVLWDGNPRTMHHKAFVIDNHTVILGSYNPTQNAFMNNAESMIIIQNQAIAQQFVQEYERIKALSSWQ